MSLTRKNKRNGGKFKQPTLRQLIMKDLGENLLEMFNNATEEDRISIENDIKDLIKSETDFNSYEETPIELRKILLRQSLVFILYGE